jgi:hypothetical protein
LWDHGIIMIIVVIVIDYWHHHHYLHLIGLWQRLLLSSLFLHKPWYFVCFYFFTVYFVPLLSLRSSSCFFPLVLY